MKMITRGALVVLILIACASQLQASAENENAEGEGYIQDTEESTESLFMHDYLYLYEDTRKKEARAVSQDQMPPEQIRQLEITTYLHTALYCIVLVYGLLHLPIWQRMYYKFNKAPEAAEPEEDGIKEEEASKLKRKSVAAKEMS